MWIVNQYLFKSVYFFGPHMFKLILTIFLCYHVAKYKARTMVPPPTRLAHGYPQGWFYKIPQFTKYFCWCFRFRALSCFLNLCGSFVLCLISLLLLQFAAQIQLLYCLFGLVLVLFCNQQLLFERPSVKVSNAVVLIESQH